ncbi:MAG: hypothetical protein QM518_00795 [Verrucomicrobiota bacterium]|jgi:hypothetical protein|nr:hypothetical protein [Verrucomicrobiota bacterium]HCF93504.1 hypothetical protein [Verrucomicrobiota bacterium]
MQNSPDDTIDMILGEAQRVLNEMKKTKAIDQRKVQSEVLLNLCQSFQVFAELVTSMMDEDDIDPFSDFDD